MSLAELLAQLARMGVIVWQEHGELCWERPPEAALGDLSQHIERYRCQLLECCHARHRRDPLSCPLAVHRGSQVNLLCLHPIHGGVFDYRHVAAELPALVSVYGFQAVHWLLQGRVPGSVELMAQAYARCVLDSALCEQPAILLGVSSGGFLALEMARYLAEAGCKPLAVMLGDTRDWTASDSVTRLLFDRLLWLGLIELYWPLELLEILPHAHRFWRLDEGERIDYLVTRAGTLNDARYLIPVTTETLQQRLPSYRSYVKSYRQYEPGPCGVPSVYLMSSGVGHSSSERIRRLLPEGHRVVSLQGGHLAALSPASAPGLARVILEEVERASGGRGPVIAAGYGMSNTSGSGVA